MSNINVGEVIFMTKPSRWDKKREELRRKIIEKSLELFQTQGFQATTMEQIAEVCDIARGTLYNHFPNKESIIQGYLQNSSEDSEAEILEILEAEGSTYSRLLTALSRINQWSAKNEEILKMHTTFRLNEVTTNAGGLSSGNLYRTLLRIIEKGQQQGELRKDSTAETLTQYLVALYTASFFKWLQGDKAQLGEKEMANLLQFFLYGAVTQS